MFHVVSRPVTFHVLPQSLLHTSRTVAKASHRMSSVVSPRASLSLNRLVEAASSSSDRAETPPAQTETPPARPEQPALQSGLDIDAVQPNVEAQAGRAGAKIRTGPARNSRIIVRIARGEPVTITGTLQHGGHRWFRVTLEDGREGFARDDVIVSSEGGAVRL